MVSIKFISSANLGRSSSAVYGLTTNEIYFKQRITTRFLKIKIVYRIFSFRRLVKLFERFRMNQRWFECKLRVEFDSVICRSAHLDLPASSLLCYMHYPWVVLFRRHQWMVKLIAHAGTVLYAWQGWRRHLPFIAGDDRLAPPPSLLCTRCVL